jgi:hypothetical protein
LTIQVQNSTDLSAFFHSKRGGSLNKLSYKKKQWMPPSKKEERRREKKRGGSSKWTYPKAAQNDLYDPREKKDK